MKPHVRGILNHSHTEAIAHVMQDQQRFLRTESNETLPSLLAAHHDLTRITFVDAENENIALSRKTSAKIKKPSSAHIKQTSVQRSMTEMSKCAKLAKSSCKVNCTSTCIHGTCLEEECICNVGYAGDNCTVCAEGFRLSPNGTCQDINGKDCSSTCTHGTCLFEACICDAGYTGDKCDICSQGYEGMIDGTCQDINECLDGTCGTGSDVCFNTQGSFLCLCKEGFVRDGKGVCQPNVSRL